MTEDTVVTAVIQAVEHNYETGWFNIKTSAGRFDTKIKEKADEALALKGREVQLFYSVGRASGNINPHTNQPYPPNNYYESARPIGAAPQNGGAQMSFDEPARGGENPERSWRICLQTGGKLAVATLPLLQKDQQTFDNQKAIALAWGKFFFFTPVPHEIAGVAVMPQRLPAEEGVPAFAGGYDTPPPHTDTDIPY
jgi:hypothetical protein